MARRATRGDNAQFTYDFGIAIAQSTVNKVARLTGVTLSLASAFYALKTTATEYVDTLRENTLRFGGMLSTMKAMQQAQDRLITGISRFDVRDQMSGMNQLMAAGVDVKKNMDWIEKAAHATGKSFDQFSGMIANAVQGNLQGLVDAGLMTQRATKAFTKFQGNTRMMQGAVMNFLRNHKGLMSAIKNDFVTIEDGVRRLKAVMTSFLQSIIGKPNDPNSLYGSVARVFNMIADKFGKDGVLSQNMKMLRQYGEGVGIVMSWTVRKIGEVMVWLGRQAKKAMVWLLGDSETFAERMRSLVVWLEFWKLKVVDVFKTITGAIDSFYKEHKELIKVIGQVFLAYLAWGYAWRMIGKGVIFIESLTLGFKGLTKAITMAGGALGLFARYMTLGAFGTAGNRAILRLLGIKNVKVFYDGMVKLGHGAASAFAFGFSTFGKMVSAIFFPLLHPIRTLKVAFNLLMAAITAPIYYINEGLFRLYILFKHLPRLIQIFAFRAWQSLKVLGGKIWVGVTALSKGLINFLMNLPVILKAVTKAIGGAFLKLGAALKWFFLNPMTAIKQAYTAVKAFYAMVKVGIKAIYASNPVGWIILAITLVATLYTKCRTFRVFINNLFKFLVEYAKLVWNLVYGAFVYTWWAIRKTWQWLKDYVFLPIANFFKAAWVWIKDMWKAFMNTTVGRFINDYIVSPLKTLFDWMLKAWNWIVKAMAKAVEWIAGANSDLAKNINALAAENGLPQLAAAGGAYDTNDDTNYLNPKNWGIGDMMPKGGGNEPQTPKNPLLSEPSGNSGNGGGGTTNNISLSNGAVQIIVPKGTDIDEARLARMVRDEIRNLDRENRMRGGDI